MSLGIKLKRVCLEAWIYVSMIYKQLQSMFYEYEFWKRFKQICIYLNTKFRSYISRIVSLNVTDERVLSY